MPAGVSGPAFFSTRMSSAVTSSAGSSMRLARSSSPSNTIARASISNSDGVAAERFTIAPRGASEPNRATSPPTGDTGSPRARI